MWMIRLPSRQIFTTGIGGVRAETVPGQEIAFPNYFAARSAAKEMCRDGVFDHMIVRPDGSVHEDDQVAFG